MSGHSKWNNIKRKKEASDAKKANIFSKLGKEITIAVKTGNSGDINVNRKLKDVVAKAKAQNMPNDNINRCIQKAIGDTSAANYEEITYEGYGPAGVAIMVDTLTDNRNRTAADVRHLFSKHGGNLGETGCVGWMFKRKGVFAIDGDAGYTEDDLMMLVLDSGAEDIKSEDGTFEITTEPADFEAVEKVLADNNVAVMMSEISMIPDTMAELSSEDAAKVQRLIDALEDLDDVQDVFTNADLPDEE